MAADLEAAIQSLISGDATALREANTFLLSFVETQDSWKASLDLFQSPNEHVRFFASNILYTKVKRHWVQLNATQQDEIYRFLINVVENLGQYNSATAGTGNLKGSNEYQAFVGRAILSLCCVCSFATDGLAVFMDIAFRKINLLLIANPSEADVMSAMVGLEMLHLLPTEVDAMDIGASTRGELEDQLVKFSPLVLKKVDQISISALVANLSNQYSRDLHIAIIKAMRSWLLQGITLTNLFEDHEVALRLVCASLQSDDPERVKMGSSFLRELVCVSDYPRSRKRDEAVILLMQSFVESASQLAPFFDLNSDRGDQDVGYEICYCMVSIASQEIELTTSQQCCNVEFFRLLLSCATLKPRKIASLTFDLWLSLQDTPVSERHPYTHQEIFETLLDILIKQSMYPPNFTSWRDDTDDDEDDFKDFRDKRHGMQDVLLICCHALREKFFDIAAAFMFKVNPGDSSPLESYKVDGRWQEMESAVFVLHNCMDAVKGMVKSESSKAPSLQFLASALHLIFSLPENIMRKPEVQATICQTLGCLTFLIANQNATKGKVSGASSFSSSGQAVHSSFPPLPSAGSVAADDNVDYTTFFLPALNVLFQCLSSASSSMYAAKAILQLCVHGQKILLAPSLANGVRETAGGVGCNQLVDALISVTVEKIADDSLAAPPEDPLSGAGGGGSAAAAAHPMLTVIEAVVRTLVALPTTHLAEALTRLGLPIVDCLHREISVGLNFDRVTLLMHYAGQLIRFSDAVDDESALLEFLTLLWGQLQVLESDTRWNNSPMVLNSLFDIYGRAIMSAKNLVIPEVPRITQTVVTVFQMRNSSSTHSMQCASVIVEALCNQSPEKDAFLVNLLEHCTRVLVGHAGSGYEAFAKEGVHSSPAGQDQGEVGIFGYDPECIEKFFRFLYSYFIMCPNIVAQSPEALSHLPLLAVYCLLKVKENGPVRLILTVLQSFWSGGGSTNRKIDEGVQRALLSASLPSGKQLASHLIDIIGGSVGVSSILWPNAIDTLYFAINGCERAEQAMLAREWIGAKMAEDSVFVGRIPTERKQFVYETMFRLAAADRRRFKQLLQDVCKICSCEVDSEVLSVYQT